MANKKLANKKWAKIITPVAIIATVIFKDELGFPVTEGMMEHVVEFVGVIIAGVAAWINTDK